MSANFPASGSLGSCSLASRPTLGLAWLADVLAGASTQGHRSPPHPLRSRLCPHPSPRGAFAVQLILSSYNLTSLTDSRKMTNFVHNPDSPPPLVGSFLHPTWKQGWFGSQG